MIRGFGKAVLSRLKGKLHGNPTALAETTKVLAPCQIRRRYVVPYNFVDRRCLLPVPGATAGYLKLICRSESPGYLTCGVRARDSLPINVSVRTRPPVVDETQRMAAVELQPPQNSASGT